MWFNMSDILKKIEEMLLEANSKSIYLVLDEEDSALKGYAYISKAFLDNEKAKEYKKKILGTKIITVDLGD